MTWIVLVRNGYDFEFEMEVEAPSAHAARRLFLDGYKGPEWRVARGRFRVTRKEAA